MKSSPDLFYAVLAMQALFASATYCALSRTRHSIALLVIACLAWLLLNTPIEGDVLIIFTKRHGLTSADLLSFAGLGFAFMQYRRLRTVSSSSLPQTNDRYSPIEPVEADDAPTEAILRPRRTDSYTNSFK